MNRRFNVVLVLAICLVALGSPVSAAVGCTDTEAGDAVTYQGIASIYGTQYNSWGTGSINSWQNKPLGPCYADFTYWWDTYSAYNGTYDMLNIGESRTFNYVSGQAGNEIVSETAWNACDGLTVYVGALLGGQCVYD